MPCVCTGPGGDAVVSPPPAALIAGANLSALNERITALAEECAAMRKRLKYQDQFAAKDDGDEQAGHNDRSLRKLGTWIKVGDLELKCLRAQIEIAAKQDVVTALALAESTARRIFEGDGKEYDGGKN